MALRGRGGHGILGPGIGGFTVYRKWGKEWWHGILGPVSGGFTVFVVFPLFSALMAVP